MTYLLRPPHPSPMSYSLLLLLSSPVFFYLLSSTSSSSSSSSSSHPLPAGESDAQTAAPLPQRHLRLLCWQPAAAGADSGPVQRQAKARSRQTLLA